MTEGSGPEALARQSAGTSTAAMGQPTEPPASPLSTRIRNAWWDSSPKATDGSKDARTRSRFSWFRSGASGRKSDADRGRTSRKPVSDAWSLSSACHISGQLPTKSPYTLARRHGRWDPRAVQLRCRAATAPLPGQSRAPQTRRHRIPLRRLRPASRSPPSRLRALPSQTRRALSPWLPSLTSLWAASSRATPLTRPAGRR